MVKKLKFQLCVIPTIFFEFEKDIEKNIFDLNFLYSYHSKLCFQLNQLFDEDKTATECFLHSEYEFRGRDWTSGETWSVSLSDSIRYDEKIELCQLREKKFPVPA